MTICRAILAITGLALLLGCNAAAPASSAATQGPEEAYCVEQGGQVVARDATWNTNGDVSQWLPLGGQMSFCEFESGVGDEATRISVDLTTLYSENPTLASIAYLSVLPPVLPDPPGPNPAEYNCLNGFQASSSFGNSAAGGGWVNSDQPVFRVMNMCVFPDMSAIDAFGLLYHQQGAIRGADLSTKFRYQPEGELPRVWTLPR